jgi:hypothetical protein
MRFGKLINGGFSINDAADSKNAAVNAAGISRYAFRRRDRQYPYKSRGQWLKAVWGFTGASLFVLFNGWQSFTSPFSPADFVASYISVSITPLFLRQFVRIEKPNCRFRVDTNILVACYGIPYHARRQLESARLEEDSQ